MAPARHETPAGAGPPKVIETKTSSSYGTRSSKRKAGDISTNGASTSQKVSSSPSSKSAEASEPKLPPSKKRRSSSNSIQQPVKTPEPTTPEEPEPQTPPVLSEIPEVTVDAPSGSSADEAASASPQKPVGWEEPPVLDDEPVIPQVVAPVTRGRGGFRGRGGRGRGRGRGRGGRGASALSGRSTPQVASTPVGRGRGGMRGRGRGRGRARNIAAPQFRALYDRRADLKNQYRALATIQKVALSVIADKSLARLESDPKYHESLPQYEMIQNTLKENYEQHLLNLKHDYDRKLGLLERQQDYDAKYQEDQLMNFIEETLELYETRIKEQALYVYHQGVAAGKLDEIPFAGGEDGRVIKILNPVEQIVPDVALGPFAVPTKANPEASFKDGDNYFEQHPANWWAAKTLKEKNEWEPAWLNRKEEKRQREVKEKQKWGRGKKSNAQSMNANPPTTNANPPTGGAEDEDPESSGRDDENGDAGSPRAAAPTGATTAAAAVGEDAFSNDDAPAQPTDAQGVSVPRLSARHNNRIVCPPPVTFDEDEIGNRITKSKKDNPNHRYGQTPANPRKFYLDQSIRQHNSAKNTREDLDQGLVEKHKLHPRIGITLPESINPDHPVNDWKAPLQPTNPIMFIQSPRPGTDRAREAFRTSRSQWMMKADQDFDEAIVEKMNMRGLLQGSGDLEVPPEPEEPEEVIEEEPVIDQALIKAVDQAEASRQEEARQAAVAAHHAQFSPPPPPAQINPPTPQRYDPVRDRTYRTPYAQPAPLPPPPPPTFTPAPRGELDTLADAAQFHSTLPASNMYMPQSPYRMPQPIHPPQPQQPPQLMPAPYGSVYPPLQTQQYQPAPRSTPGNRHRELRPAPPQNRPPPPPAPPRPWW